MRNSRIAFILWFLSIIAFIVVAAQREVQLGAFIFSTIVYALLMGLYLMFSDVRIAEALPQFTRNGGEYGLPGFLFLLYVILVLIARITNPVIAIVVAGATLWVPVGLWSRNEEALTPIQAVAGLAVLLIPLGVDVVLGARPDATGIAAAPRRVCAARAVDPAHHARTEEPPEFLLRVGGAVHLVHASSSAPRPMSVCPSARG